MSVTLAPDEPLTQCLLSAVPNNQFWIDPRPGQVLEYGEGQPDDHTRAWLFAARIAQANRAWSDAVSLWRSGLVELQLVADNGASEASVLAVARLCPHLVKLVLYEGDLDLHDFDDSAPSSGTRSCIITDKVVSAITTCCTQLEELALSGADNDNLSAAGIASIGQHCPRLRVFDVSTGSDGGCPDAITDGSIAAIASGCPQLQELRIHSVDSKLSDASLLALRDSCPQLEKLSLDSAEGMSPASLLALIESHSFVSLRFEEIGPAAVTDELVMALAKNAPRLVDLALGDGHYCRNQNLPVVLDASWNALTQGCPLLEDVACNGEWSKAALENFARHGLKPDGGALPVMQITKFPY